MAAFVLHLFSSSALLLLGIYHLISTIHSHLKSPRDYSAKPYHPLPFPSSPRLKHLPLYLLILSLLLASSHQALVSSISDPLLKGSTPVHRFTSLQSSALLFLFLVLSISLLISETTSLLPFPSDFFFALAAALFFLQFSLSSSSASLQTSLLQAKCDLLSSRVSALLSLLCLILALQPKLFVADVGLGASLCLKGLWVLQTGLSLYVDGFIPEGCHRMLDVPSGVEGSTKCDSEESKLRASTILDLLFVVHVLVAIVIVMVVYAVVAKSVGRIRFGSYEPLSTTGDSNHVQLKTMAGAQA